MLASVASEVIAAIVAKPGRSFLTTLGTVLGVGTLIVILGLTSTASGQVSARFDAQAATTVTVKDAKGLGSITDIDGNYKIKVEQYATLVFSYLGYKSVSVLVKGDRKVIDVRMTEEKVNAVDEVVVTGLGRQKKLTVTGAIMAPRWTYIDPSIAFAPVKPSSSGWKTSFTVPLSSL